MRLLRAIANILRPNRKAPPQPEQRAETGVEPGRSGATATVEVDPRRIGSVRTAYTPRTDGNADPGEIVWTWVPYQERDGRGKDRPVLVVAAEPGGTVLAVQLTSQEHPGRTDYLPIGAGSWDGRHRPSYANIARVFRVHQAGMRREAASLDSRRYAPVRAALVSRYGWR
ncbi:type II toxin-antitoxin system PemK/MazF family toxin [Leifsonia poae]|uniref:type II toxin-antitoxin system PemK/MazF family toxin n=1 Tax=Leifsonia poae TaxID=110933 RepID=UPI003D674456